jgi:lactoylglutathione lyase
MIAIASAMPEAPPRRPILKKHRHYLAPRNQTVEPSRAPVAKAPRTPLGGAFAFEQATNTRFAIRTGRPAPAPILLLWSAPIRRRQIRQCFRETRNMRYLHTMLRVRNLDAALKFYQDALGLKEVRRVDNDKAKFTLVFLCAADDEGLLKASKGRGAPLVELTYNWDEEKYGEDRYFGHLAYEVDDIYATCARLMKLGITINRPPRDGQMAFVRSPDLHSIELLQKGDALPPAEPWTSMSNTGHW